MGRVNNSYQILDNCSYFGSYWLINSEIEIRMMIPKNIENKEIGLLGLGVSGKSAFKSLKAGGGNIYA